MRKLPSKFAVFACLFLLLSAPLTAYDGQPFIGEISVSATNFETLGWFFCDGQALDPNQYPDLFAVIGTTYGGDGVSTFKLPDMNGRVAIGTGQGAGLTNRVLGDNGGQTQVVLSSSNLPAHNHSIQPMMISGTAATSQSPTAATSFAKPVDDEGNRIFVLSNGSPVDQLGAVTKTSGAGSSQPMNVRPPFQNLKYIIAFQGIVPTP